MIKLQCVIYKWIRLDELYKLIETFFSNFKLILNYWQKPKKILNEKRAMNIDRSAMCNNMRYTSIDSSRHALQTNYASPPSVTEEVYCFPRRQLFFSFESTFQNRFRLSVPRSSNE